MTEKEVLKLYKCLFDTGNKIVCRYTEKKLSVSRYGHFLDFLKAEKHNLFHLANIIPCCECNSSGISNLRGKIEKWMFEKLYDESNSALPNHVKQRGTKVIQQCLHKYKEKNISTKELDMAVLVQIIRKFLFPTSQEEDALKKIVEIRNKICHVGNLNQISKPNVVAMWKNFENVLLALTDSFDKDLMKTMIKLSKEANVEEKEVDDLRNSIAENSKYIEGLQNCQTNICQSFQNEVNGLNKQFASLKIENREMFEGMEKRITDTIERSIDAKFVELIGQKKISVALSLVGQLDKEENIIPISQDLCCGNQTSDITSITPAIENSAVFEEFEVKNKEINKSDGDKNRLCQSLEYAMAMSAETSSTIDKQDNLNNDKGTIDMTIKINSDDFDEDSVVRILPNMKTVHWYVKSARKNCIILDIRMFPEAMKDEQTFRESLRSLLQEMLKAGNVDINKPGTIEVKILVQSSLTAEDEQKLKTWINSWKEKFERNQSEYTEEIADVREEYDNERTLYMPEIRTLPYEKDDIKATENLSDYQKTEQMQIKVTELQAENKDMLEQIRKFQRENEEMKMKVKDLQAENETWKRGCNYLKAEKEKLEKKCKDLMTENEKLSNKILKQKTVDRKLEEEISREERITEEELRGMSEDREIEEESRILKRIKEEEVKRMSERRALEADIQMPIGVVSMTEQIRTVEQLKRRAQGREIKEEIRRQERNTEEEIKRISELRALEAAIQMPISISMTEQRRTVEELKTLRRAQLERRVEELKRRAKDREIEEESRRLKRNTEEEKGIMSENIKREEEDIIIGMSEEF